MRQLLILLSCWLGIMANAWAQNRIDTLVEEFSTIQTAKFTSAVERDEQTSEVVRAVKTLNIMGMKASSIRSDFRTEASKHNSNESKENGTETYVFTMKSDTASRIYMMKYKPNNAAVTIIINRKQPTKRK